MSGIALLEKESRTAPRRSFNGVAAAPFVKWAGGKRALVPEIVARLPQEIETYWEPFVGGGAVFFGIESQIRRAKLSDINDELVNTYNAVIRDVDELIELLKDHRQLHDKEHYLAIRENYYNQNPVWRAARFIYLNKTCYNGLYRVNRSGMFNVPIGSYVNPNICDEGNIRAASRVLKKAKKVRLCSFERIKPEEGDFVYCDPPYDETFTKYTDGGFGPGDQERLRDACVKWSKAGVSVMISNNDTPRIRHLYKGFKIHKVMAARNINCNGEGRDKVAELIITSYDY